MGIKHPPKVPLAQLPTPLQPLDRLSEAFSFPYGGPRLWVKRDDLTETAMSGNKLRKLEFIVAAAQQQHCDTLITCGGLQSNHCRATALVGARLGLQVQLVLRGPVEGVAALDGNLLVDYLAGAEVAVYPAAQYQRELPSLLRHWQQHYAAKGHRALCIPTGGSDHLGLWGYLSGAEELLSDCRQHGFNPEHILSATGSGGTQAGLALGCYLQRAKTLVTGYAVCDNAAYFQAKMRSDLVDWVQHYNAAPIDPKRIEATVNDQYIGPGYGLAEEPVYRTITTLASLEGLLLDPVYTGKAFHGLLQDLQLGRYRGSKNLVFVHTGGHFGLFPHRQNFDFLLD